MSIYGELIYGGDGNTKSEDVVKVKNLFKKTCDELEIFDLIFKYDVSPSEEEDDGFVDQVYIYQKKRRQSVDKNNLLKLFKKIDLKLKSINFVSNGYLLIDEDGLQTNNPYIMKFREKFPPTLSPIYY